MREGFSIRFLIVALPAGLLLSGILAVLNTHFDQDKEVVDPNERVRLEAAALNRQPVSTADLANSLEILAGRIGERHLLVPEKLESAAVWIESTLGPGNIGYVVERQVFEANNVQVRNLIAELPGKDRRDEIVVVAAHYDTVPGSPGANSSGSGMAALISLARAFAGDSQSRTIRFVALVNEESPEREGGGAGGREYVAACRAKGYRIVAMINLRSLGFYTDAPDTQKTPAGVEGESFGPVGNFLALIGENDDRFMIDSAKTAFAAASAVPVVGRIFARGTAEEIQSVSEPFREAGVHALVATDTASFRYPHHHQATDTLEKIDLKKLESVTVGLKAVLDLRANP